MTEFYRSQKGVTFCDSCMHPSDTKIETTPVTNQCHVCGVSETHHVIPHDLARDLPDELTRLMAQRIRNPNGADYEECAFCLNKRFYVMNRWEAPIDHEPECVGQRLLKLLDSR